MMNQARRLQWGDQAPGFVGTTAAGAMINFHRAAGRQVLLLFVDPQAEGAAGALGALQLNRDLFDDAACACFVVFPTLSGQAIGAWDNVDGIHCIIDPDRKISMLFGAADRGIYHPHWILLDRELRVVGLFDLHDSANAIEALRRCVSSDRIGHVGPPVAVIPRLFEPELCDALIAHYQRAGGEDSGFMQDVEGRTTLIIDHRHKQRKDHFIEDRTLREAIAVRVARRLNPVLKRVFQFEATRIERYVVVCYESGAGHFRPHRDNTTRGTAHRQFAVSLNLNSGFEGGDLRFPEYGQSTFRPPEGGAIVFSCGLLHEVTEVTQGCRYAFLPFLYNEDAAVIRDANKDYVAPPSGSVVRRAESPEVSS